MPRLAKDQEGKPLKRKLLGGRAEIVVFENKPGLWIYRQLLAGTKRYYQESLDEYVEDRALRKAEEIYLVRQSTIEANGDRRASSVSIEELLRQWVRINEDKQRTGRITSSTLNSKSGVLMGPIRTYLLKVKKLQTIGEIRLDTFLDYRHWRVTEAWKTIRSTRSDGPPQDSTVKRDLVHLKDWFANFLIPRGFATFTPTIEKITISKDQLDANPPIPLKPDWEHVYSDLEKWAEAGEGHPNPRVHYWRQMFRHFVLISYNAGTRPSELLGKIEKRRRTDKDGNDFITEEIVCGLRWEDIETYWADHSTESGKTFKFLEATIHIRKTKTGEPREVPCNAGTYFKRWREYCDKFRREQGLRPLTSKDYVFFQPYNDRPYAYTHVSNAWSDMRDRLGDKLSPIRSDQKYTLYSLRSSYITNQIEEGKDVYLIKQLTGHSLEILSRHYDRSQIKSRRAEATARTYAKEKESLERVDLENLPVAKEQAQITAKRIIVTRKARRKILERSE